MTDTTGLSVQSGENYPASYADDLLSTARRRFRLAYDHWRDWRTMARDDYAIYAGDQWDEEDKTFLLENDRAPVVFNRTAPIVDAVHGTELNNRQEARFNPREMGDVKVNELLTNAGKWVRDNCDAEDEESDAFLDLLICGIGWTETRLDMERNPDGDVVIDRIDPLEMLPDPSARKRNLGDMRWLFRYRDVSREELDGMGFNVRTMDLPAGTGGWGEMEDDNRDPHLADEAWKYERNQSGMDGRDVTYRLVEYQWLEKDRVYRMADPMSGKVVPLSERKFRRLMKAISQYGIDMQEGRDYVVSRQLTAKRAFFVGSSTLEQGPAPYDKWFTYTCMTGKRDRNRNYWFGLVRALADPQQWANKFFSQIMDIINSNAKGGVIAEQNAFVDPRKAEEDWAKSNSIVIVRDGALSGGKVQERTVANYPVGIDRMMQFAIGSFREVSGVNLEMLGMAEKDQPGVLEYQRKQAGLTILAAFFSSLRQYRKDQGRLLLHFIVKYISDGRLIRIEGDEGAQYVPLVRQADLDYDVVVDEAPSSPNQKDRAWGVLVNLVPQLAKLGIMPPPEVIDYLPLPTTLTDAWKRKVMAAEQDPSAQQAKELELREKAATVAKLEAEAQAKLAQAQKDGIAEYDLERQKMEGELILQREKQQAEMDMKREELALKAQTMQVEMSLKAQQAEQEAMLKRDQAETEADLQYRKVAMDADVRREDNMLRASGEASKQGKGPKGGTSMKTLPEMFSEQGDRMAQAVDMVAKMMEQSAQTMARSAQAMEGLSQAVEKLARPKRLIRDAKGRAVGVE